MAMADLIARLEHDADETARRLLADAEEEARAMEVSAREACERRIGEALDRLRLERRAALEAEMAEARRSARRRELEAQGALVRRVRERARSLFAEAADTDAYRQALPRLCDDALSYVEGIDCLVRCRPADVTLLAPSAGRHGHAQVSGENGAGPGFLIQAADGSVTIDETLDARLVRLGRTAAAELLAEVAHARE